MKYLLLILICLSSLVQADVLATSEMTNGYRLFLFNSKDHCENGFDALLAGEKSRPLHGCWLYDDEKVYLNYEDGDFRIYPIEHFKVRQNQKAESTEQRLEL